MVKVVIGMHQSTRIRMELMTYQKWSTYKKNQNNYQCYKHKKVYISHIYKTFIFIHTGVPIKEDSIKNISFTQKGKKNHLNKMYNKIS